MASSKKPTYKVEINPVIEKKRRKSDLVLMWQSFVDVTAAVIHEMIFMLTKLWQMTVIWFGANDRQKVLKWISQHLRPTPEDFDCSWRDGILLCTLLDKLLPGCFPYLEKLDPNCSMTNVYCAFDVLEKQFGICPNITIEEVVTCATGSDAKLFETLNELMKKYEEKSLLDRSIEKQTNDSTELDTSGDINVCQAKGNGLLVGFVGRVSSFVVHCPLGSALDAMIVIRGPSGSVYSERITNRSPRNKTCFDTYNTFKTIDSPLISRSISFSEYVETEDVNVRHDTRDIPLEYRICENEINIAFVPQERGQHLITVLWRGRHIDGSPYLVNVEDTVSRLSVNSELRQLRSALKPESKIPSGCSGAIPRKTSVRFELEPPCLNDQKGKVKSRKVIRYIVNVDGQDIVVDGDRTGVLGPALLKLDYDNEGKPKFSRRNSWGFVGDTAIRRKSRIRQFRLNVDDLDGVSSQRRSSSLSLMRELPKRDIDDTNYIVVDTESFSKQYNTSVEDSDAKTIRQSGGKENVSVSSNKYSDPRNNDIPALKLENEREHAESLGDEKELAESLVIEKEHVELFGIGQDRYLSQLEMNRNEKDLYEVNEILCEKKNVSQLGKNTTYQAYLNAKNLTASLAISRNGATENLTADCVDNVETKISGNTNCKTNDDIATEEAPITSSKRNSENKEQCFAKIQAKSNRKKMSTIHAFRIAIRQEVTRFALRSHIYEIQKFLLFDRVRNSAAKKDYLKTLNTDASLCNFQVMSMNEDEHSVVKKRKINNQSLVNKSHVSSKYPPVNVTGFANHPRSKRQEKIPNLNLSESNEKNDPGENKHMNLYKNVTENVKEMTESNNKHNGTPSCKTWANKRLQFRSTRHRNISAPEDKMLTNCITESDREGQAEFNPSSVQTAKQKLDVMLPQRSQIQHRNIHMFAPTVEKVCNPLYNKLAFWEKSSQKSSNTSSRSVKDASSVIRKSRLANFQSIISFWETAYRTNDDRSPTWYEVKRGSSNNLHTLNIKTNIGAQDINIEERQHSSGDCRPDGSAHHYEDEHYTKTNKTTKTPLDTIISSPRSDQKRCSSDPGLRMVNNDPNEELLDGIFSESTSRSCSLGSLASVSSPQSHSEDDVLANEKHCTEDEYIDDEIPDCAPVYWGDLGALSEVRKVELLMDCKEDIGLRHIDLQRRSIPGQCTVFGIGVYYGYVAVKNRFQVLTSGAGSGNLSVSVHGNGQHIVTHVSVVYERKDIYSVMYQVTQPGYYIICVRWMNEAVPGSPFVCKVTY